MKHRSGYVTYEGEQKRSFLVDMLRPGSLEQRHGSNIVVGTYDTDLLPFSSIVEEMLLTKGLVTNPTNLGTIHRQISEELRYVTERGARIESYFYDTSSSFRQALTRFLAGPLQEHIGEPFLFQSVPHFRFNFPDARGTEWHGDTLWHNDLMNGQPPQLINIWVPVTEAKESATIKCLELSDSLDLLREYDFDFRRMGAAFESSEELHEKCSKLARTINVQYGDFIMFDSRCIHGGSKNRTAATRISFDFRIVPHSQSKNLSSIYASTGPMKLKFEPGSWFDARISSDLLPDQSS